MDHIQELAVASMADLTLPDATLQKKRRKMQLYIAEGTPSRRDLTLPDLWEKKGEIETLNQK